MKLDILVLAAHPDDAELGCGATIAKHVAMGFKVGVVDFTQGELGTRGTIVTREKEAADAAKLLGLSIRENLKFADGFFANDQPHQLKLIQIIRKYKPEIVLANAIKDRHPDHARASQLSIDSCFLSGLAKIETTQDGIQQEPWRPKNLFHYIQSQFITPDFVVDVSSHWNIKMESILAYKTQFHNPSLKNEPETYISKSTFLTFLEARGRELGQHINVEFGEGFTTDHALGVDQLFDLRG
jgi:N-acetylglucosamine malate deacetylase 1